jgi:two-component system response regulator
MTPQVVHLNLKLPGLDGLGLLRLIRGDERAKFLSAAIFTSSIKARDQTDGYGVGANNYVSEPVDFNQFVDVGGLPPYWLLLSTSTSQENVDGCTYPGFDH